jgi:hypothetical protein
VRTARLEIRVTYLFVVQLPEGNQEQIIEYEEAPTQEQLSLDLLAHIKQHIVAYVQELSPT